MAKLTPLDPLRRAVAEHLRPLPVGALVLVACSGGADSLALAAATANAAEHLGYRAGAVIIDHGLQSGSADIAARAAQQCRDLGLDPVVVEKVVVPDQRGGGPEARAREARYAALEQVRVAHAGAAVLLGHTLNDQAETVLLGLSRGAGMRSMLGMRAVADQWHRPLLAVTRNQTEQVCRFLGLEFWVDPTNAGAADDPMRSQLRNRVMPVLREVLGNSVDEALARTADLMQPDDDYLRSVATETLDQARTAAGTCTCGRGRQGLCLDVAVLAHAHDAIRTRALRLAMIEAGAFPGSVSRRHVDTVDALVTNWHGQGPIHLPGSVQVARHCGTLELAQSLVSSSDR